MSEPTPAAGTHPVKVKCTGHVHSIMLETATCGSCALVLHVPPGVARRLLRLMETRYPGHAGPEFAITVEEVAAP